MLKETVTVKQKKLSIETCKMSKKVIKKVNLTV